MLLECGIVHISKVTAILFVELISRYTHTDTFEHAVSLLHLVVPKEEANVMHIFL